MTIVIEEAIVKSRDRVKSYGEVFTPRQMVNQMLDLVSRELETDPGFVDKTFLEPAAGDGNFLVMILRRKLVAIQQHFDPDFWVRESLFALASIYGIELLEDNHSDAQAALLAEFCDFHSRSGQLCPEDSDLHRAADFLIENNVIRGNTLTGLTHSGEQIQFSWWNRVAGAPDQVQREPFTLASLRGGDALGFDFTTYTSYAPCRVDHVYKEVRA